MAEGDEQRPPEIPAYVLETDELGQGPPMVLIDGIGGMMINQNVMKFNLFQDIPPGRPTTEGCRRHEGGSCLRLPWT
jgi:hypothetical protein